MLRAASLSSSAWSPASSSASNSSSDASPVTVPPSVVVLGRGLLGAVGVVVRPGRGVHLAPRLDGGARLRADPDHGLVELVLPRRAAEPLEDLGGPVGQLDTHVGDVLVRVDDDQRAAHLDGHLGLARVRGARRRLAVVLGRVSPSVSWASASASVSAPVAVAPASALASAVTSVDASSVGASSARAVPAPRLTQAADGRRRQDALQVLPLHWGCSSVVVRDAGSAPAAPSGGALTTVRATPDPRCVLVAGPPVTGVLAATPTSGGEHHGLVARSGRPSAPIGRRSSSVQRARVSAVTSGWSVVGGRRRARCRHAPSAAVHAWVARTADGARVSASIHSCETGGPAPARTGNTGHGAPSCTE